MDIKLLNLILKNFKGVKGFSFSTDGHNINIFADNGVGKTTLFDAFKWLLFDKDSTNRKDFSIKTFDKDGQVIHGLEHEVEAILSVDGTELKLKKQLTEKWTKKRGESEKEFTGHETSYWVDDVPVKKGEYQQRINGSIDENIFKLITDPFYFNQILSWQDRRKMLLEISGDLSDEEVIERSEKLKPLIDILKGKSIEDYRKIVAEKISKLNKEIEKIPVRIDELMLSSPQEDVDYSDVENSLAATKTDMEAMETQLLDISNRKDRVAQAYQDLSSLKYKLSEREREFEKAAGADKAKMLQEKTSLENERDVLRTQIKNLKARIEVETELHGSTEAKLESLRKEYDTEKAITFVEPDKDNFHCPTCRQALPTDDVEEKIEKLRTNFEASKGSKLVEIKIKGKTAKAENDERLQLIRNMNSDLLSKQEKLVQVCATVAEIDQDIEAESAAVEINYSKDPAWQEITKSIEKLNKKLSITPAYDTADLLAKKKEIQETIDKLNSTLSSRDYIEGNKKRITELKKEERELSKQLNELDKHKFLMDEFIKTKVNILEDKINSKFKHVNFKLFDVQINGGVVECCETLVKGVPWSDANHAGRTNAGMDIINTLSEHYKVHAPIFIDNRESVIRLIHSDSQLINLVVSEKDKKLRIEYVD